MTEKEIKEKINELEVDIKKLQDELRIVELNKNINPEFQKYIGKWIKYSTNSVIKIFFVKKVELNKYNELVFYGYGIEINKRLDNIDSILFLKNSNIDYTVEIEYIDCLEIINDNNLLIPTILNYINCNLENFIKS